MKGREAHLGYNGICSTPAEELEVEATRLTICVYTRIRGAFAGGMESEKVVFQSSALRIENEDLDLVCIG